MFFAFYRLPNVGRKFKWKEIFVAHVCVCLVDIKTFSDGDENFHHGLAVKNG